jgi:tRNA(adenine34) deaminase
MRRAIALAERAAEGGDVPVGALVVSAGDEVIGEGWNVREVAGDPTGHAELLAIRSAAAELGSWRLEGCTLVVTMEPCPMCAGALMLARVERVVLGGWDPKLGACGSVWDLVRDRRATHRAEVVGGVLEEECGAVVRRFFEGHRNLTRRP